MLEPWIIEEIRRREDERNRERDARRIELPLYEERRGDERPSVKDTDEQPSRGVVIMDM